MRTKLAIAIAGSLLLAVSLSGRAAASENGSSLTPEQFVKLAFASKRAEERIPLSLFPKDVGSVSCVIRGGGPAPGVRVPGTCATRAKVAAAGSGVVKFIESWNAHRFHSSRSPSHGKLSYTWELKMSARGRVLRIRSYGDYPPQYVM